MVRHPGPHQSIQQPDNEGSRTDRAKLGALAEDIAADFLIRQGSKLVARNLRVGRGEVDLVALIEGVRSVVEVRSMSDPVGRPVSLPAHPLDAFDGAKGRQVRTLANLLRCPRVDLIAIRFGRAGIEVHWVKYVV